MSTKRLQADIEKCLRECQGQLQIYDRKWRELKCYNEAIANSDWGRLGEIRHAAPPLCQFPCLQHLPGHAGESLSPAAPGSEEMELHPEVFVSVDISCMQEREICEVREKLRTELETLMKKVYRIRQLIIEWLHNSGDALRLTCFSREQLLEVKKEIESRSRRGRVFYLRGISSDDTQNEEAGELQEALVWIEEYMNKLQQNIDLYTASIEKIALQVSEQTGVGDRQSIFGEHFAQLSSHERLETLSCAVDACTAHSEYLDCILRKLRNNSIFASASDDPADLHARVQFVSMCLQNIKRQLQPYVKPPHDPLVQVPTIIYQRLLQAPKNSAYLTPPRKGIKVAATTPADSTGSALLQSQPTQTSRAKMPALPTSESVVNRGSADLTLLSATPPTVEQPAASSPLVSARRLHSKQTREEEAASRCNEEQLRRRLESLPVWRRPDWAAELTLSAGVSDQVYHPDSYGGLNSEAERKQVIDQLEKILQHNSTRGNTDCLPVLMTTTELPIVTTTTPWSGETYEGRKVLGDKPNLLCFDGPTRIERLCQIGNWTYGRIHGQPNSRAGWFPSAYAR